VQCRDLLEHSNHFASFFFCSCSLFSHFFAQRPSLIHIYCHLLAVAQAPRISVHTRMRSLFARWGTIVD